MDLQKKLRIQGIVMLSFSLVTTMVFFLVFGRGVTDLLGGWFLLILVVLAMVIHLGGSWWILYQFAITRKRMSNKLHLFNRVSVIITLVMCALYLVFGIIFDMKFSDDVRLIEGMIGIAVLVLYVFYQENNTNNFVVINLNKKLEISRKEYNQLIGFLTGWIGATVLWVLMAAGISINFITFFYITLILVQNGLSYTTYGQSRQWNFTYEIIAIGYILSFGIAGGYIILTIIGLMLGLLHCLRQWKSSKYKIVSRVIGSAIYLLMSGFILLNNSVFKDISIEWLQVGTGVSECMLVSLIMFLVTFSVAFVVNEPTFLKGLSTK